MKKILMILTMALVATSCMDILDVAPEAAPLTNFRVRWYRLRLLC